MAHGSEEEGDYWPGYVDALTSMVQVLAFVMMLLAMAVFVLSQNVSKGAVEAIAKAAKMDVPPDANVTELTAKVVEAIQKQQAESAANAAAAAAAPPRSPKVETEGSETGARETTVSEAASVGAAPAERRGVARTQAPEKPAEPSADAKRVTLHFAARNFKMDGAGSGAVSAFVDENKVVDKNVHLLVRAYASSSDGALSEARRLAYYRAMTVRKELTDRKIPAENIRINVYDTADKDQGSSVEIYTDGNGDR